MNFYTLIFNHRTHSAKRWIRLVFISLLSIFSIVGSLNYIVDPYKITDYNLLNIKHKLTTDDRDEKVNYFSQLDRFDNIILGSSRVYSINPRLVTQLIGGSTYNFGVGSATVEDILGIVKYLDKSDKLPTNLIVGVDFYTFNRDIPPHKKFLKNKKLNYISYAKYSETYVDKLFSFDAIRASIKILKVNYIKKIKKKINFDELGWAGRYEDYNKKELDMDFIKEKRDIEEKERKFYSNNKYFEIDQRRVKYFDELKLFSKEKGINLFIFTTPLHPLLLSKIENNRNLKLANKDFLNYLNTFDNFTNLYHDKEIYNDLKNFKDTTHTTSIAGDIILKKVLLNI